MGAKYANGEIRMGRTPGQRKMWIKHEGVKKMVLATANGRSKYHARGRLAGEFFYHAEHEEREGEEGGEYEFVFEMSLFCDIDGKGELGRARYQ